MFLSTVKRVFSSIFKDVDWILLFSVVLISLAGLVSMNSFGMSSRFFERQIVWLFASVFVFLFASVINWSFLKNTRVVVTLFALSVGMLSLLFVVGSVFKGAQSWFSLGAFALQPVDPIKLVVILILAKYFSRRHMEIANIRHILVSGFYVFVILSLHLYSKVKFSFVRELILRFCRVAKILKVLDFFSD
jgi:cell division protein FtsW (lipid II flippase)